MNSDIPLTKARVAYAAPALTVFGGVAELTAAGSGRMTENEMNNGACGMSMSRAPCKI